MIQKSYKFRIYPNSEQEIYFSKCFGCVRFFFNKSLSDMVNTYNLTKEFDNITPAKYKEDYPFLKEIDSFVLCNAQMNRNDAFRRFFNGQSHFPCFKSKKSNQSFTTNNHHNRIRFIENGKYITIAKCSSIKIVKHRDLTGQIKSATVSKTRDNKYFISLLVEENNKTLPKTNRAIGLDVGVKDLLVDSFGNKYKNPKFMSKKTKKLQLEERRLSHMEKESANWQKQRVKIAKLYRCISNQRNDYLHKLSKHIVDENQVICVEDISVMGMSRKNDYNQSLYDSSLYRLLSLIKYKAQWYGRTVVKVPSNYPSSQLCSSCGHKNSITKNLSIRKWICPYCQSKHDRDINAARNILSKGIEILTKDGTHPDSLFMLGPSGSSSKKPTLNMG